MEWGNKNKIILGLDVTFEVFKNPARDLPGNAVVKNPMQRTWVQYLPWEDPACPGAMKPVGHNC